jgi:sorbitol-specific phosphotransferase system component IIC
MTLVTRLNAIMTLVTRLNAIMTLVGEQRHDRGSMP